MHNPNVQGNKSIFGEQEKEQEKTSADQRDMRIGGSALRDDAYRRYLERLAQRLRPTIDDFEVPGVYNSREINLDERLVEQRKHGTDRKDRKFRDDQRKRAEEEGRFYEDIPEYKRPSRRMELLMLDLIGKGWFYEEELYGRDQYLPLYATPTMEADDRFGHVDLVCTFGNKYTGAKTEAGAGLGVEAGGEMEAETEVETEVESGRFRALPFGVDITCTDDEDKIYAKLNYRHVYGRKPDAPQNVSEFELADHQRLGTKMVGLTSVKYFIDKNEGAGYDEATDRMNTEGMRLPIGRIEMMPKLVLGASSELAENLLKGRPDEKFRRDYGDRAYERAYQEYQIANKKLQWCVLLEGDAQARAQLTMLMDYKERNKVKSRKLEQAIVEARALAIYFGLALQKANSVADIDAEKLAEEKGGDPKKRMRRITTIKVEKLARNYALNEDPVCQGILRQTERTYFG